MPRRLAPLLFSLALSGAAFAAEPPTGKASFPLPTAAEAAAPERPSSLNRTPTAVAALPPPAVPAPTTVAPTAPPPSPRLRPAEPVEPTESSWEVSAFQPRRTWSRGPVQDVPAPREGSSRDRDSWMLSLEGVTRAPIDIGGQAVLETPVGLRLFGAYGWVPDMYLGNVLRAGASLSSDPIVASMIENGFQSGRAWRLGAGWRPFRAVGVYLDAGYARVSLRGDMATSDVVNIPGVTGSYAIDSTLGFGFVEIGYQAKIAERVVLAAGLGLTKVMSADTRATPSDGAPDDPNIETATDSIDRGLEKYGYSPTLTLRLGLDLI
ncbi:MAG: hypothetical protein IT377_12835 [Polyangiaceae bacterium]|nr:hypothetical protein [Polyangiaceae bacterium]